MHISWYIFTRCRYKARKGDTYKELAGDGDQQAGVEGLNILSGDAVGQAIEGERLGEGWQKN